MASRSVESVSAVAMSEATTRPKTAPVSRRRAVCLSSASLSSSRVTATFVPSALSTINIPPSFHLLSRAINSSGLPPLRALTRFACSSESSSRTAFAIASFGLSASPLAHCSTRKITAHRNLRMVCRSCFYAGKGGLHWTHKQVKPAPMNVGFPAKSGAVRAAYFAAVFGLKVPFSQGSPNTFLYSLRILN